MGFRERLSQRGFDPSFEPILDQGRWEEWRDPNLGKTGYIYREIPHEKGTVYLLVFTIWKSFIGHEHIVEYPDGISGKDQKNIEKQFNRRLAQYMEEAQARQDRAKIDAQKIWETALPALDPPSYLQDKHIHTIKGYKTDPQNAEQIIVPIYNKNMEVENLQYIHMSGQKDFVSFGKTKGNFGVVEGDGELLYICEGFSTALSIHLATGSTVAFVLSSSNYADAVPNILASIDKIYHVVCADDDRHLESNVGYNKAAAMARRYNMIFRCPKFKNYDGKNTTDFNDLHRLEGIEEAASQLHVTDEDQIKNSEAPSITALGHKNNQFYFVSTQNKEIQCYSKLTKSDCFQIMNIKWWEEKYGEPDESGHIVINWSRVESDLYEFCHAKGLYDGSNNRGLGVFEEQGKVLVNLGKKLIYGNVEHPGGTFRSKYTYLYTNLGVDSIHPIQLSDEEVEKFRYHLTLTNIKEQECVDFIVGWMACAILAGYIDWRPHVYLTGPRGSGKTILTKTIQDILSQGFKACFLSGEQTTAVGVRQTVQSNSIPVFLDEVEGDQKSNSENAAKFISLFRSASSNSGALTVIGSASQNAISFKVSFCAWIASITPQLKQEQDKVRFALIEMMRDDTKTHQENSDTWRKVKSYWDSLNEEWSKKLVSRIINNAELIRNNIRKLSRYIGAELGSERHGDQYGSLLGGALIFKHTKPISDDEMKAFVEIVRRRTEVNETLNGDGGEMECLNHILEMPVRTEDNSSSTLRLEINRPLMSERMLEILWSYGVLPCEHNKEQGYHIRPTHLLAQHLKFLPQYNADFIRVLSRIKGVKTSVQKKAYGKSWRGIWIPKSVIFDAPKSEPINEEPF